jgi:hypothetical protein
VLCTGVERAAGAPFFAGGKWRFVERVAWWNQYTEDVPVIVGHYWRRLPAGKPGARQAGRRAVRPHRAHGLAWRPAQCVLCGLFGGRALGLPPCRRAAAVALQAGGAALAERDLVFDDGTVLPTLAFQDTAQAL